MLPVIRGAILLIFGVNGRGQTLHLLTQVVFVPYRIVFIDHCVNMQCQKHSNPKFDLEFDPKINRGPSRVLGNITVCEKVIELMCINHFFQTWRAWWNHYTRHLPNNFVG